MFLALLYAVDSARGLALSALLKLLSFQDACADLGLPPLLLLLLPGINDCHPAEEERQDTKEAHFHGV
jgi:hypothetical protein